MVANWGNNVLIKITVGIAEVQGAYQSHFQGSRRVFS